MSETGSFKLNEEKNFLNVIKKITKNTAIITDTRVDIENITKFSKFIVEKLTATDKEVTVLLLGIRDHEIARENSSAKIDAIFKSQKAALESLYSK